MNIVNQVKYESSFIRNPSIVYFWNNYNLTYLLNILILILMRHYGMVVTDCCL